jgi:hypothetical protein
MVEAAEIAQAMELVRALGDKVSQMCSQLARLDGQDVANRNASRESAELRCDISHAQVLIDRLQRKYLTGDNHHAQRRPSENPSRIAPRARLRAPPGRRLSGFQQS